MATLHNARLGRWKNEATRVALPAPRFLGSLYGLRAPLFSVLTTLVRPGTQKLWEERGNLLFRLALGYSSVDL